MKKYFKIIPFFIVSILLSSCGSSYNTNLPPPSSDAEPQDVFPAEIDGERPDIQSIESGYRAIYGQNKVIIRVQRGNNKVEAENYFQNTIYPEFDAMSNHLRGTFNGQTYAKGSHQGRRAFGWVNMEWVFVIDTEAGLFDETIKAFQYIEE